RYTLFHRGSEEVARLLEASGKQNLYQQVLEAVLDAQPEWHDDSSRGQGVGSRFRSRTGLRQSPFGHAVARHRRRTQAGHARCKSHGRAGNTDVLRQWTELVPVQPTSP